MYIPTYANTDIQNSYSNVAVHMQACWYFVHVLYTHVAHNGDNIE